MGFNRLHRDSLGFLRLEWVSVDYTGFYWVFIG